MFKADDVPEVCVDIPKNRHTLDLVSEQIKKELYRPTTQIPVSCIKRTQETNHFYLKQTFLTKKNKSDHQKSIS